ncbi:unnamed protein product [Chrysodeixis includens]|uniref:Uncharacterized protein n=1 Tax=Chrysodeixis includens TaxID=689277 RepID=A0A9N8KRV0_CHRIL|nr:unnamed protein product [Chrysodeixis includens]
MDKRGRGGEGAGARGRGGARAAGDQPPASVNDPPDAPCRIQPILRTDLYRQNAGLHNGGWRSVTSGRQERRAAGAAAGAHSWAFAHTHRCTTGTHPQTYIIVIFVMTSRAPDQSEPGSIQA